VSADDQIATALGYDPGGDGRHGVAAIQTATGEAPRAEVATVATVEHAVAWLVERLPRDPRARVAIGIDTLTMWSTGSAGWRPADAWLRARYPAVVKSVAAPNSLFGSMPIGGLAALVSVRERRPNLIVSETHPKVLYFALAGTRYAFDATADSPMRVALRQWTGIDDLAPLDDHQWDALVSAWAVREGASGRWPLDLHDLPTRDGERLVRPCGPTHFYWPADPRGVTSPPPPT
jgi:hypothetical protein